MEYTSIKIDGYWIVVDKRLGQIHEIGKIAYAYQFNIVSKIIDNIGGSSRDVVLENMPHNSTLDRRQLYPVIASQNPAHNLPGIIFSDEVVKELGIVDLHKYAKSEYEKPNNKTAQFASWSHGFAHGYKQCSEDNKEKKYTEEDVRKIIIQFATDCDNNEDLIMYDGEDKNGKRQYNDANKWVENYIQSLNKQEYKVELEMENVEGNCDCYDTKFCKAPKHLETGEICKDERDLRPKVTNNCVTIKKIIK